MPGPGGYWLIPPRMAATAASATSGGPSVSGKPCPRLTAPVSSASADISAKTVVPSPSSRWATWSVGTPSPCHEGPLPQTPARWLARQHRLLFPLLSVEQRSSRMVRIALSVDGQQREDEVEPRLLLVHYLRERAGKVGTPVGCDTSNCGACTVQLDGQTVKSCSVLAVQADGAEVTTIEGIGSSENLHPLQEAFWTNHGLQCGYCTPGMIMAAADLLNRNPDPSEEDVRHALEGHLCRCTGYHNIVKAVLDAATKGSATEDARPPAPPVEDPAAPVAPGVG